MKQFLLIPTLAILTLSCGQTSQPNIAQPKVLGTLEIQMGSRENPVFAASRLKNSALTPKSDSDIQVTFNSFVSLDAGGLRTLTAVYNIKNNTASTVNNLSLIAYAKSGNSNSSALKSINAFSGAPSSTNIKNVFPAQGTNGSVAVAEFFSDLQAYSTAEADTFTSDARTAGLMTNTENALEYGFVVRQSGSSHLRSLAAGATGRVALSMKIPVSADVTSGSRFTMTFVVATNDASHVVQSLEEPLNGTAAAARATNVGVGTQVRVFSNSTSVATPKLTMTSVRTAGTSNLPVAMLYPTLTYTRLGLNQSIPDGSGQSLASYGAVASQTFNVSNLIGNVSKVTLRVKIAHEVRGDLRIRLTAPNNTTVILFLDTSSSFNSDQDIDVTFDDAASSTVAARCYTSAPTCVGFVKPQNPLSVLNGSAVAGNWLVQVDDGWTSFTGILQELELTIANTQ